MDVFKGKTEVPVYCPPQFPGMKTMTASFGYPFKLNQVLFQANVNVCGLSWEGHVFIDYSSLAQFY